jgi:hypothetical protein
VCVCVCVVWCGVAAGYYYYYYYSPLHTYIMYLCHKFKFLKLREGMDEKVVDRERRERHVIRRYPLASMSVTQFGKSQEITADASSVSSTRGVVR